MESNRSRQRAGDQERKDDDDQGFFTVRHDIKVSSGKLEEALSKYISATTVVDFLSHEAAPVQRYQILVLQVEKTSKVRKGETRPMVLYSECPSRYEMEYLPVSN